MKDVDAEGLPPLRSTSGAMCVDSFSRFLQLQLEELHDNVLSKYKRSVGDDALGTPSGGKSRSTTWDWSRQRLLPSPLPIPVPTPPALDLPVEPPTARTSVCESSTFGREPRMVQEPASPTASPLSRFSEACTAVFEAKLAACERPSCPIKLDKQDLCFASPVAPIRWSIRQPRSKSVHKDEKDCGRAAPWIGAPCSNSEAMHFVSEGSGSKDFAIETSLGNFVSTHTKTPSNGEDVGYTCGVRSEWIADERLVERLASTVQKDAEGSKVSVKNSDALRHRFAMGKSIGKQVHSVTSQLSHNIESHVFVLHPHSLFAVCWDLVNLCFILYDIVVTPLRLFVLPPNDGSAWADLIVTAFFSCDCLFTFNRGVYVEGEINFTRRAIARKYVQSWFLIDMLVLIPDWVTILMGSSLLSTFSMLRMLRLTRLLRLLQIDKVVSLFQEQFNSNYVVQVIDLIKLVGCIALMVHVFACAWCMLRRDTGWEEHALEASSLGYLYVSSLHWSLTQFHGGTDVVARNMPERTFNVIVLFLSMLAYGSYLSRLTDMMLQMEKLHHSKTKATQVVRKYLDAHNISTQLAVRVKRYVNYHVVAHSREAHIEFLSMLPHSLMLDLLCEGRTPTLRSHSLFQYFLDAYPRALRIVCHEAISETASSNGDVVFASGDASSHMMFLVSGMMTYTVDLESVLHRTATVRRERASQMLESRLAWKLRKGFWVCEPALWTAWTNVGEVEVVCNCVCLLVNAVKLAAVLKQYEEAYVDAVLYAAEYVHTLNASVFATDLGAYVDLDTMELENAAESDRRYSWPFSRSIEA